jgi:hypothetical protein
MYAIKAHIPNPDAETYRFRDQKTMYAGKRIAENDEIFLFASETQGGSGLIARGIVTAVEATPKQARLVRQTPRVGIRVKRTALARRRLGRDELKRFSNWNDERPETELNFKFYRQVTNKIVGISAATAVFLRGFF